MTSADISAYLDCRSRVWLEEHAGTLPDIVHSSPGALCVLCHVALRCTAFAHLAGLLQSPSTEEEVSWYSALT